MTVLGYDPFIGDNDARALGAEPVSFDALIARSDWVTVHTPLSPETRGMIGARQLAAMKKGVYVVNCARGGIVDEEALADALESGHVAGVALDVFEKEPPGTNRLLAHPRSVFAPHLGAATIDAQRRVATDVAESIGLALARGEIRDAVNPPR
jgi:D-3-phosphoglycerate dehydrogenase